MADSLPRVRLDLADTSGVEAAAGAEFSWRWEVARETGVRGCVIFHN